MRADSRAAKRTRYKRPFDLVVLSAAVVALLPVWVLVWSLASLAIWLEDRGPVFFRQARMGKDGREFTFMKFRTMVLGAEEEGLPWTTHDDPRVTKVGRFLRRIALDEFPQIIHVLKGEMSMVGPRAMSVVEHREALTEEPRFGERLQVRPGLIGVALLYLPRSVSPRRKLRYDLVYIRRASLWLDIRLLLLTVWPTLTGRWGTGHRKSEGLVKNESMPTGVG